MLIKLNNIKELYEEEIPRHISRWLNGVVLVNADAELFNRVLALPFVDTTSWIPGSDPLWFPPTPAGERFELPLESPPDYQYGIATEQIQQIHTREKILLIRLLAQLHYKHKHQHICYTTLPYKPRHQ